MYPSVNQHGVDDDDQAAHRDLNAAAAGDREAFGRVYDRHAAVVLSLCRRTLISPAEADDALQETFIRAFGMLSRVDDSTTAQGFRQWLYAITRRVCAERRRAAIRRNHHEGAAMNEAALLERSRTDRALQSASDSDDLDRLTIALDQLDDDQRLAIHLHYLDADPAQAAQSALGLSRSAYYKLLGKAREKLAAAMAMKEIKASRHQDIKGFEIDRSFETRPAGDKP